MIKISYGTTWKYMISGLWNTGFGYFCGVLTYKYFIGTLNILLIGLISGAISITMAFITYKLFVFRTHGNWLLEYFKCYVVYGSTTLLGIVLLWIFIDKFSFNIWLAQGLIVFITAVISFYGHNSFTFSK